jgi:Mg2+ and Co2+ transporter CorA
MRSHMTPLEVCTSGKFELIDGIVETDALIETKLAEIESLLERNGDAALEMAQLRELRRSCGKLKELLGQYETMPVGRGAAPR